MSAYGDGVAGTVAVPQTRLAAQEATIAQQETRMPSPEVQRDCGDNRMEMGVSSDAGVEKEGAKQRRKKWSFEEKMQALNHYHQCGNKMHTVREFGIPCGKMLRGWLKDEEKIRLALAAQQSGADTTAAFRLRNNAGSSSRTRKNKIEMQIQPPRRTNVATPVPLSMISALPEENVRKLVDMWLAEDTPSYDFGGAVIGNSLQTATLYAKSSGVLAGFPFFTAVFDRLGCFVNALPEMNDGTPIIIDGTGTRRAVATVRGPVNALLRGERPALNALACCCGVATAARAAMEVAQRAGWKGRLAGTRKTTPGFRLVEKYGMLVGGMDAHRMDLSGMVMLKDNHIAAAGNIKTAVEKARALAGFSLKIDVECSTLQEAFEAARAGADVVMLDNMTGLEFKKCAKEVKERYPNVLIEGSGGLTLLNLMEYICPEGDVLSFSVNRLAAPMDLSLKIARPGLLASNNIASPTPTMQTPTPMQTTTPVQTTTPMQTTTQAPAQQQTPTLVNR